MSEKDCLGCKVTGTLVGLGTGSYLLYEAYAGVPKTRAHKMALIAFSAIFFTIGGTRLYRN